MLYFYYNNFRRSKIGDETVIELGRWFYLLPRIMSNFTLGLMYNLIYNLLINNFNIFFIVFNY